ncbi:helix-turn-helix domain-containing protein [Pseudoxanthomonas dokdonensis]|uniref:HTH cro/C1-type domain-containing protein n=1 Tax=Pseudoxanthomonas dokdonensis TaxID=344882 RepID=A0A0R0CV21_9GAMM|nr:helix-turn-helix domain-containing protein [Pseudoxanthomonas dokdonensis]KRG69139.1 hypothetical protein ABB29_12100 [Pseudoxanthomonas dokdonensis]
MKAINLIRDTGMTTAEIAEAIGCTTHSIRYYERGERFPNRRQYRAINELATRRGVTLSAADFAADFIRTPAPEVSKDAA